ncbi:unnamed protein product, partial [Prorocentrum cordatum]
MHRAALLPDEALAQGLRLAYTAPGGSSEPRLDTDGLVTLSVYLDGDGTAVTEGATMQGGQRAAPPTPQGRGCFGGKSCEPRIPSRFRRQRVVRVHLCRLAFGQG